jgi:hypothetical protein
MEDIGNKRKSSMLLIRIRKNYLQILNIAVLDK